MTDLSELFTRPLAGHSLPRDMYMNPLVYAAELDDHDDRPSMKRGLSQSE